MWLASDKLVDWRHGRHWALVAEHAREPAGRVVAEGDRLLVPASLQGGRRGLGVHLRGAGAIGGELEAGGPLARGERASELGLPLRHELVACRLHRLAARRPRGAQAVWHALDLGDAVVVHDGPGHPTAPRQL